MFYCTSTSLNYNSIKIFVVKMKDKIKNIKNQLKTNKNKMEKMNLEGFLEEEEKRTKPNSKDGCEHVFVNVRMERLKTEQIVCNIQCKTFTRQ